MSTNDAPIRPAALPPARPAAARRPAPAWLSLPAVLFIGLLFLAPVLQLLMSSLVQADAQGRWQWSAALYAEFFADAYNWRLMARTLAISGLTVVASLALALPVALHMRRMAPRWRTLLAIALLSPLLTSVVVRTLAWVVLLGPQGLLNQALASAGLPPVALIYNGAGVVIGLTHVYFGYMLLSLMTSILKIDDSLILAAHNLGASRWQVLLRVILPLARPGIAAGAVLVFTMSASAYVTPVLLGGTATRVMATEIYDQAIGYLEWREAAATATVLFLLVWAGVALFSRLGDAGRHGSAQR